MDSLGREWGRAGGSWVAKEGFNEIIALEEAVVEMAQEGVRSEKTGVLGEGVEVGKEEGKDEGYVELVFNGVAAAA